MKMRASASRERILSVTDKIRLGRWNLLSLACCGGEVTALHRELLVPFLPMFAHGLLGTVLLSTTTRLRLLGLILFAESMLFGALVITSL